MAKILHIITRLDRGGSAENTLLTCLGLAEKYELVLVHGLSLESHMTDWEKQSVDSRIKEAMERGVNVIPVPSLVRRISPFRDLQALFYLWRLMIREKPDMVHTHTSKAGILGRWAAWLARVPIVVHTAHGHIFYGHFGPLASRFFVLLERFMALITDRLIALTVGERNDYLKSSVSRTEKIVTIHSGVEIDDYLSARVNVEEKRESLGISTRGLVVGTVGWLLPIKGPMHLLNAMESVWQDYPEATLVFVGKGDLEKELRAKALQMGVSDRVKFLGWRDDIPELMQILDVFVLPSLNEGMGRVLAEAMAAGKPVIASHVGGIPDLVKPGQNGFLVEPGDLTGLSRAITRLLSDKKIRDEMGRKGREMCQDFSVEKMIEKIDVLYASLFKERSNC
ncbi:MAG: glycosyltransferase family 4 protein [Desulfobacterales bacterium]|nr:glycosyltransferase family 4 protein [Desulfobacterales bacterium]